MRFCNDFDMSPVKRFYAIANSASEPVRGWIGHRQETKWFFPLKGNTTIAVEPMEGGIRAKTTYVLISSKPSVLEVPPGNWFAIEQDGSSEVMVFSSCLLGEFKDDDFRRPA